MMLLCDFLRRAMNLCSFAATSSVDRSTNCSDNSQISTGSIIYSDDYIEDDCQLDYHIRSSSKQDRSNYCSNTMFIFDQASSLSVQNDLYTSFAPDSLNNRKNQHNDTSNDAASIRCCYDGRSPSFHGQQRKIRRVKRIMSNNHRRQESIHLADIDDDLVCTCSTLDKSSHILAYSIPDRYNHRRCVLNKPSRRKPAINDGKHTREMTPSKGSTDASCCCRSKRRTLAVSSVPFSRPNGYQVELPSMQRVSDGFGLHGSLLEDVVCSMDTTDYSDQFDEHRRLSNRMVINDLSDFVAEAPLGDVLLTTKHEFSLEYVNTADYYREHFIGKDHQNYVIFDNATNPAILSLKTEASGQVLRAVLRNQLGSRCALFDCGKLHAIPAYSICTSVIKNMDTMMDRVNIEPVSHLCCLNAAEKILSYDERLETNTFKFGVILQRSGQITEEGILGNTENTEHFSKFLSIIGERVQLNNFNGYRGGLDSSDNSESYHTMFNNNTQEIMFHVCTMLPYNAGDHQQLQRKRHIGNDIVVIVFQEDQETVFSPDMLQSNFIHCVIVVRLIGNDHRGDRYKVVVLRRNDVPMFGQPIPSEIIGSHDLRQFLLTKSIQAEYACYKARRFQSLQTRTRLSLLRSLISQLKPDSKVVKHRDSSEKLTLPQLSSPRKTESSSSSLITHVRKAINRRFSAAILGSQSETTLQARAKSLPSEFPSGLKAITEYELEQLNSSTESNQTTTGWNTRSRTTSEPHRGQNKAAPEYSNISASRDNTNDDVSNDSLDYTDTADTDEGYVKGGDSRDDSYAMSERLNTLMLKGKSEDMISPMYNPHQHHHQGSNVRNFLVYRLTEEAHV